MPSGNISEGSHQILIYQDHEPWFWSTLAWHTKPLTEPILSAHKLLADHK